MKLWRTWHFGHLQTGMPECLFQRPLLADANIKIVEAVSKAHRMGHEAFGIVLTGNKYGTGEALAL